MMEITTDPGILRDIEAVRSSSSVRSALELLCESTGCRVALVARVTDATWNACEVVDRVGIGLRPGDALELSNTY
jgi:hypothetical protein